MVQLQKIIVVNNRRKETSPLTCLETFRLFNWLLISFFGFLTVARLFWVYSGYDVCSYGPMRMVEPYGYVGNYMGIQTVRVRSGPYGLFSYGPTVRICSDHMRTVIRVWLLYCIGFDKTKDRNYLQTEKKTTSWQCFKSDPSSSVSSRTCKFNVYCIKICFPSKQGKT